MVKQEKLTSATSVFHIGMLTFTTSEPTYFFIGCGNFTTSEPTYFFIGFGNFTTSFHIGLFIGFGNFTTSFHIGFSRRFSYFTPMWPNRCANPQPRCTCTMGNPTSPAPAVRAEGETSGWLISWDRARILHPGDLASVSKLSVFTVLSVLLNAFVKV